MDTFSDNSVLSSIAHKSRLTPIDKSQPTTARTSEPGWNEPRLLPYHTYLLTDHRSSSARCMLSVRVSVSVRVKVTEDAQKIDEKVEDVEVNVEARGNQAVVLRILGACH